MSEGDERGRTSAISSYISRWTHTSHILIGLTNLQRHYGLQHMVRESNERIQNANLVLLPGAVNCAGSAYLAKCSQHFTS